MEDPKNIKDEETTELKEELTEDELKDVSGGWERILDGLSSTILLEHDKNKNVLA